MSQDSWEDSVWAQDEPSPPESAGADGDHRGDKVQDQAGDSDDTPEAMCSAAGAVNEPGGGSFVDLEAGRSSGSEANDDAEDDDDVGSMDGFVVKDEEATSSDYETDEEEEPIAHGRLRRGSDSVEREAAEAPTPIFAGDSMRATSAANGSGSRASVRGGITEGAGTRETRWRVPSEAPTPAQLATRPPTPTRVQLDLALPPNSSFGLPPNSC